MCILERNEFKETTSSKLSDIIDLLGCRGVHRSGTRAGDAAIEVGSPTDLEISEQITDGKKLGEFYESFFRSDKSPSAEYLVKIHFLKA